MAGPAAGAAGISEVLRLQVWTVLRPVGLGAEYAQVSIGADVSRCAATPRRGLLKLLEQVTPEEKFLRQIPKTASECDIVYPSALPEKLVRRRLHLLATECTAGHRRWLFWSWAALPFTVATVVSRVSALLVSSTAQLCMCRSFVDQTPRHRRDRSSPLLTPCRSCQCPTS